MVGLLISEFLSCIFVVLCNHKATGPAPEILRPDPLGFLHHFETFIAMKNSRFLKHEGNSSYTRHSA